MIENASVLSFLIQKSTKWNSRMTYLPGLEDPQNTLEIYRENSPKVIHWLGEVLKINFDPSIDLVALLRSGDVLCRLITQLYKNIRCHLLEKGTEAAVHKIVFFLEVLRSFHIKRSLMFQLSDILIWPQDDTHKKAGLIVLRTILTVEKHAKKFGFAGPYLNLKLNVASNLGVSSERQSIALDSLIKPTVYRPSITKILPILRQLSQLQVPPQRTNCQQTKLFAVMNPFAEEIEKKSIPVIDNFNNQRVRVLLADVQNPHPKSLYSELQYDLHSVEISMPTPLYSAEGKVSQQIYPGNSQCLDSQHTTTTILNRDDVDPDSNIRRKGTKILRSTVFKAYIALENKVASVDSINRNSANDKMQNQQKLAVNKLNQPIVEMDANIAYSCKSRTDENDVLVVESKVLEMDSNHSAHPESPPSMKKGNSQGLHFDEFKMPGIILLEDSSRKKSAEMSLFDTLKHRSDIIGQLVQDEV